MLGGAYLSLELFLDRSILHPPSPAGFFVGSCRTSTTAQKCLNFGNGEDCPSVAFHGPDFPVTDESKDKRSPNAQGLRSGFDAVGKPWRGLGFGNVFFCVHDAPFSCGSARRKRLRFNAVQSCRIESDSFYLKIQGLLWPFSGL